MKKAIAVLILAVLVFSLTGCCLKHEWKDATCTEPKTCAKCGKTEGEPTGHEWKSATCTEPKTCIKCGETKGEPNGHIDTVWKEESVDTVRAKRKSVLFCNDCGKEIDRKTEDIESFIDGNVFLFTAKEFVERLQRCYDDLDGGDLTLKFTYAINNYGNVNFDVFNQYDTWLAWGTFYDVDGQSLKEANEDGKINCVALFVPEQDGIDLDLAYYLFQYLGEAECVSIDPSITDSSVYSDPIFSNVYADGEGSTLHGLTYSCYLDDGEFSLYIEIPD